MKYDEIQTILKALECCGSFKLDCCRDCPYNDLELTKCTQKLAAGAFAYIKELGGLDV